MIYPYFHIKKSSRHGIGALIGKLIGPAYRTTGTGIRNLRDFTFSPRNNPRARMPYTSPAARFGTETRNAIKPLATLGGISIASNVADKGYKFYNNVENTKGEISSALQRLQMIDPRRADDLAQKATWGVLGSTAFHMAKNFPYYLSHRSDTKQNPIDAGFYKSVFGHVDPLRKDPVGALTQAGILFSAPPSMLLPELGLISAANISTNALNNMPKAFQQYAANMYENYVPSANQTPEQIDLNISRGIQDVQNSRYVNFLKSYFGDDFRTIGTALAARANQTPGQIDPNTSARRGQIDPNTLARRGQIDPRPNLSNFMP
jgi:hypothetical protein